MTELSLSEAAAAMGRKGRAVNSKAQQEASKANGRHGGRPRDPNPSRVALAMRMSRERRRKAKKAAQSQNSKGQ
jgi:hypothetical protein